MQITYKIKCFFGIYVILEKGKSISVTIFYYNFQTRKITLDKILNLVNY